MNLSLDLNTGRQLIGRHPSTLSAVELGGVLDAATLLDSYISLAREEAEKRLADGGDVEGWEIVPTSGKRSIPDAAMAARQLAPLLKHEQIMECATIALGKLQDAIAEAEEVSAKEAKAIMADYLKGNIVKSPGGQKLQPKPKTVEVAEIENSKDETQ